MKSYLFDSIVLKSNYVFRNDDGLNKLNILKR